MAGPMRKMMEYLSFAEPQDEVYDDEYVEEYDEPRNTAAGSSAYRPAAEDSAVVEREDRTERFERVVDERHAEVTPISPRLPLSQGDELRRIVTVHPTTYNEARTIGEAFRDGTPVIMNLTGMNESDAKCMVDFAAGLVFGLHGTIERVTNRVFLLSPANVEVESDAADHDQRAGRFFNQS